MRRATVLGSAATRKVAPLRLLSRISTVPRMTVLSRLTQFRGVSTGSVATAAKPKQDMFCFQCEQTREGKGCTTIGVCGKTPEVADLQDLLVHLVKGISQYASQARAINGAKYADTEVDHFVSSALFSTVTNVNFDPDRMAEFISEALRLRESAKLLYTRACREAGQAEQKLSGPAVTQVKSLKDRPALLAQAKTLGIPARKETEDADVVGLQEMVTYGLKGTCAYAEHARHLGSEDPAVWGQIHDALAKLADPKATTNDLWALCLQVGAINLRVMELLDAGHTSRFGSPTPQSVSTTPVPGKCILVTGHDMNDLENILKQTEGTGVNVYTHGEMLPAHGYPGLRKYKHLVGHFGGPWQLQKTEFAAFPGAIVATTNCIIEPRKSYKHRMFTRSVTGWPGVVHISQQDYSPAIKAAQEASGFSSALPVGKPLLTGFGHNAVMQVADKVIDGVKSGAIKHFYVIGGCDGSESERSYFTDVAKGTSKDSIILTMGCGKYRFNRLDLGDIGGIPRVLDLGQCNDSYSGIQIALALAKAFKMGVNDLPLSFAVSWFEQKAVAVLLTLLHLNIKGVRLGPNLPAFATPNMLKVLSEKFNLRPTGTAAADLAKMSMNQ